MANMQVYQLLSPKLMHLVIYCRLTSQVISCVLGLLSMKVKLSPHTGLLTVVSATVWNFWEPTDTTAYGEGWGATWHFSVFASYDIAAEKGVGGMLRIAE